MRAALRAALTGNSPSGGGASKHDPTTTTTTAVPAASSTPAPIPIATTTTTTTKNRINEDDDAGLMKRPLESTVIVQGHLRRKSRHLGLWRRRYMMATDQGIYVFRREREEFASKFIALEGPVVVSDIETTTIHGSTGLTHADQYAFSLSLPRNVGVEWMAAETMSDAENWKRVILANFSAARPTSINSEKERHKVTFGGEVVVESSLLPTSSDIELAAAAATSRTQKREDIKRRLQRSASSVTGAALMLPSSTIKSTLELISKAEWRQVLITNGLRILAESALTREFPCLRVSCVLPASPDRVFAMLHDLKLRTSWDGLVDSITLLEEAEDGHSRKYHVKNHAQRFGNLFWASKRDYVLNSSWRRESDGSYVILEQSDASYPKQRDYTRARIFAQGFTICPRRQRGPQKIGAYETDAVSDDGVGDDPTLPLAEDCLLQLAIHADPGGALSWLPRSWSQEWLYAMMLRVVGLREALEVDNYKAVDFSRIGAAIVTSAAEAQRRRAAAAAAKAAAAATAVAPIPESPSQPEQEVQPTFDLEAIAEIGTLPRNHWSNASDPFKIRGKTYLTDKIKVASGEQMFDLVAADLYITTHESGGEFSAADIPGGVVQRVTSMPNARFLFVVHFQIPGPPALSFIGYFMARPNILEAQSEFSELFTDFVEGDDAFRDARFKLIPRVVKGSYIVKSAVGQTPAILGTKLAQSYRQGKGYFEVIVDVGSSTVAGGVLRVVKQYTKSLAIDLAFLLEAQRDNELPEVVLGALRIDSVDLDWAKPLPTSSS